MWTDFLFFVKVIVLVVAVIFAVVIVVVVDAFIIVVIVVFERIICFVRKVFRTALTMSDDRLVAAGWWAVSEGKNHMDNCKSVGAFKQTVA